MTIRLSNALAQFDVLRVRYGQALVTMKNSSQNVSGVSTTNRQTGGVPNRTRPPMAEYLCSEVESAAAVGLDRAA